MMAARFPSVSPPASRARTVVFVVAGCVITTLVASQLLRVFDLSNVVMVFLLNVVLAALRWGRGAGALSALLSVAGLDFFFVPPVWSFHVSDTQYLFTFALMLVVALVTGQLAARLREKAVTAIAGERRASALAAVATDLSAAVRIEDIAQVCDTRIGPLFGGTASLLLPDADEHMTPGSTDADASVAQWVLEEGKPAGRHTDTLTAHNATYLPLTTPLRTRGVLMLRSTRLGPLDAEQADLLRACQSLVALAIERVHFVDVAHESQLHMEGEKLRNALLAAVSHDLRTPLAAIRGMAGVMGDGELPQAIAAQADSMQRQIANLLDAARLQDGGTRLRREWHALDELIGAALAGSALGTRHVIVELAHDMPLVEVDALMFDRVLANLLDNAAKYTPSDATLWIRSFRERQSVRMVVEDNGPGFPQGVNASALFAAFARGERESAVPGVGLGLSLARRIMEAHGGSITASRRTPSGATFSLTLPLGDPPTIDLEDLP
jgi:two-component system sensor histidine kinase KdpD